MSHSNSRGASRIAALKRHLSDLTFDMHLFCLDPGSSKFLQIATNQSLKNSEGDGFDAWILAALYKYHTRWGYVRNPLNNDEPIEVICDRFVALVDKLDVAVRGTPTRLTAIQLLYIFFATGELKFIDEYYQCMGHEKLAHPTKQNLAKIYEATKGKYREKILSFGADHFTEKKLDLRMDVIDFSYFDNVVERAYEEKERIKLLNAM